MPLDVSKAALQGDGAPAADVVVTDEMVDAGRHALEAFYLGDGVYDVSAPTIRAVYRAMEAARSRRP